MTRWIGVESVERAAIASRFNWLFQPRDFDQRRFIDQTRIAQAAGRDPAPVVAHHWRPQGCALAGAPSVAHSRSASSLRASVGKNVVSVARNQADH